jgi:hypothetical protein
MGRLGELDLSLKLSREEGGRRLDAGLEATAALRLGRAKLPGYALEARRHYLWRRFEQRRDDSLETWKLTPRTGRTGASDPSIWRRSKACWPAPTTTLAVAPGRGREQEVRARDGGRDRDQAHRDGMRDQQIEPPAFGT